MSNQTIPGLPTISQASSAAMMWISDPNASPQDRSLKLGALLGALKFGGIIGANWPTALGENLGANWPAALALAGPRVTISTSGTLGVLTIIGDTDYLLFGATTATLPLSTLSGLAIGQRITFKNLGAFTTAISVSASSPTMYLGGYAKTAGYAGGTFYLYNVDDYVTFEYNGADTWFVVATNGPVLSSSQTADTACNSYSVWTAMGNGLSLGTLQPGVYDFALDVGVQCSNVTIQLALGVGTAPISSEPTLVAGVACGVHAEKKGYILYIASLIQGIYSSAGSNNHIINTLGMVTARRIG